MSQIGVLAGLLFAAYMLITATFKANPPYLGKYHHVIFACFTGFVALSGYTVGGTFNYLIGIPYSIMFLVFADCAIRGTNSFASRVTVKQLMIGISEHTMPSFIKVALGEIHISQEQRKAIMVAGGIICGLLTSIYFLVLIVLVWIMFDVKVNGAAITISWLGSAILASSFFIRRFLDE